ncbi:MAG: hypothetical protein AB1586_30145 [Pseudomonadota bacterium]|jgi:hypothetical protein
MVRDQQSGEIWWQIVGGLWRLFLVLFAMPVVVIVMMIPVVLGVVLWTELVPATTAEIVIPELKASVRLKLYDVWDVNHSGAYLVVDSPEGRTTGNLAGVPDWAHWSRTSLYLTEDGKIAVLGVAYSDYIVDPSQRTFEPLTGPVTSERWTYLGAFDGGHHLRFFSPQEQRECNPTAMDDDTRPEWARRQSRRRACDAEELAP